MKYLATLLFPFCLPSSSPAQTAPDREVSPGGAVNWMRTTSAGNLLVCTSEGLKGIDPAKGTVQWTVAALANAPESGFEEVKGTPFVALAPASGADQLLIVEPFEGRVLFNSREAGISNVTSKYFLYEANVIVVVGQQGPEPVMACVDMASGKMLWNKSSDFSKLTACVAAGPDEIILSTLFFAYKLNAHTGEELWKQSPDPKFAAMAGFMNTLDRGGANLNTGNDIYAVLVATPHAPGIVIMGAQKVNRKESTGTDGKTTVTVTYESFFNAFRASDGGYAWAEPVKLMQKVGAVIPMNEGLVIGGGDNTNANLMDYTSGVGRWGKNGRGINVSGGALQNAIPMGNRLLLVSGEKDGSAMVVETATGAEVWGRAVKLDGPVQKVLTLPDAIAIGSAEQVDVVDRNTGATLIAGPFKGGSGLMVTDGGALYLFNTKDGLLRTFSGGSARVLGSVPLKFEGKEQPRMLELLPKGALVSADQNMALLAADGSIAYQKYFPAPRESGLNRALLHASAVRAAYYTAAFGYTSAAFGSVSSSIQVQDTQSAVAKDVTGQLSAIYGDASKMGLSATKSFLAQASARFTATTSTQAVQYILSEVASKEFVLMAIVKVDGSVANTIMLGRNKTPQYAVDGATNSVYLLADGKVRAYR